MEICVVVIGVEEYSTIIGEVEGRAGWKSWIKTVLSAGVELFGGRMVEHEHVGYRAAANGDNAEGLTVEVFPEGGAVSGFIDVGDGEYWEEGAEIRFCVVS